MGSGSLARTTKCAAPGRSLARARPARSGFGSRTRDERLLATAQQAADLILDRHPDHAEPLIARWLGGREDYGGV